MCTTNKDMALYRDPIAFKVADSNNENQAAMKLVSRTVTTANNQPSY